MSVTKYTVTGMTCGHCVESVTTEVSKIAGVTDIDVDLDTGSVAVVSEGGVDDAAVRAAVEEAGFELVS